MKKQALVSSLVENALDFLERALGEVAGHPKFALIHFAAAVELMFKARLASIHPKWIAEEPTEADSASLAQGKLRTVGFELAKRRIEALSKQAIDQQAFSALKSISRHRNRAIHFFHAILDSEKQRDNIVAEIYVGWYYLYRLVSSDWAAHFARHMGEIAEFGAKLQSLAPFLEAVYRRVVSTNPKRNTFSTCPVCSFASLDSVTGDRYCSALCRVCGYGELSHKAIQEGEHKRLISCTECEGYQTVEASAFGYKCTECQASFSSTVMCDYCHEEFAGQPSGPDFGSYHDGCSFCDGALANIDED